MKKWIVILIVILIVAIGSIYVLIPNQLTISNIQLAHVRQPSAMRYFSNKYKWAKWWTSTNERGHKFLTDTSNIFNYHRDIYEVKDNLLNGAIITIYHQQKTIPSNINIYPIGSDSIAIQWKCDIATGPDPISKIIDYRQALAIKKNMAYILNSLSSFLENEENVYGIHIDHEIIKDTLVIAQKAVYKVYPSTTDIYKMIDGLKAYALASGATITNPPMMNVTVAADGLYQTMVAIPVNKTIKNSGNIELKNLTSGTPMLASTVDGGHFATANVLAKLEHYKQDHQYTSPAMPYEVLLTDRRQETDTTKWKTQVCDLLFPWFK